jgi:hypothetical protein
VLQFTELTGRSMSGRDAPVAGARTARDEMRACHPPASDCDARFHRLPQMRRQVARTRKSFDALASVPTPRQLSSQSDPESR